MGVDPYSFIDVDEEEYLIRAAMLKQAIVFKGEEMKAHAALTAVQLAQFLFGTQSDE